MFLTRSKYITDLAPLHEGALGWCRKRPRGSCSAFTQLISALGSFRQKFGICSYSVPKKKQGRRSSAMRTTRMSAQ